MSNSQSLPPAHLVTVAAIGQDLRHHDGTELKSRP